MTKCILLLFILIILLSFQLYDFTHDPERHERRRQNKRNRSNPQPSGILIPPFSPPEEPEFPTSPDLSPFQPSIEQPSVFPDQILSQCFTGTSCVRVRDCPFVDHDAFGPRCIIGKKTRGVCCPDLFPSGSNFRPPQPSSPSRPQQPQQPFTPQAQPRTPNNNRPRGGQNQPSPPSSLPNQPRNENPVTNLRPNINSLPQVPQVNPLVIQQVFQEAKNVLTKTLTTENNIKKKQLFATSDSEEGKHQNFLTVGSKEQTSKMSKTAELILTAAKALAKALNIDLDQLSTTVDKNFAVTFVNSVTNDCPQAVSCPNISLYRTADGSCNNLAHADWGKSFTPFNRITLPAYQNGFDSPRTLGKSGQKLPNARLISTTALPDRNMPSDILSYLFMQWGQFIDHDITGAATTRSSTGEGIRCCGPEFDANPELIHPACMPIKVAKEDPFYGKFGRDCISFVRSAAAPRQGCALGPREQLNQLSSYIDGGMIYGKTDTESINLRSFTGGLLKSSNINGVEFLPQLRSSCSIPKDRNQQCFQAGDSRVNVQANLVALHAVFLRHHNNIARILSQLNPQWNDETLYQETRRIVIAQIQHITYSEFLPLLLSQTVMDDYKLKPTAKGHITSYDQNINGQIISAFATAAYRLHTLIPGKIEFMNSQGTKEGQLDLSETFNNPSILYEKGAFTTMVNGMAEQPSQSADHFFNRQISNHLFRSFGSGFGTDLVSLNIQRGRDHGLPPYNQFRKICKLSPVNSWDDLDSIMTTGSKNLLSSVYQSVDDIDLFVGGTSENPMQGSIVGPTFNCIIAEQFRRLKSGDRYWYENANFPHSFTPDQLDEIKKITLARVLCDAGPEIQMMQPFTLMRSNLDWNKKQQCNTEFVPRVDYSKWQMVQ